MRKQAAIVSCMDISVSRSQLPRIRTSCDCHQRRVHQCRPHLVDGLGRLPRRRIVDLLCQLLQGVPSSVSVQRLVLIWAEYIGEEVRQDAAQHQIGVRDGCVAALAVAHRARMRAGRLWPHLYWDSRSVNLSCLLIEQW